MRLFSFESLQSLNAGSFGFMLNRCSSLFFSLRDRRELKVMPSTFSHGRQLYLYVVLSWLFPTVHSLMDLHVFHRRQILLG